MDSFVLNGTEFGIDRERSRFVIERTTSGDRTMDLTIYGDAQIYEKLTESEDSEWAWTLHPPKFYLLGFPVPGDSDFTVNLSDDDYEDYDTALYLMAHHPVDSLTIVVRADGRITVRGSVELSGKMVGLCIRWAIA